MSALHGAQGARLRGYLLRSPRSATKLSQQSARNLCTALSAFRVVGPQQLQTTLLPAQLQRCPAHMQRSS